MIGNIAFASLIGISGLLVWFDFTGIDRRELLDSLGTDDMGPAVAYLKAAAPQLVLSFAVLGMAFFLKAKGVL